MIDITVIWFNNFSCHFFNFRSKQVLHADLKD